MERSRRISYSLVNPVRPVPTLSFPPLDTERRGHAGPLYSLHEPPKSPDKPHQGHRLAVQALILDLSTQISTSPKGILYSGGRDGIVSAWELGLPTKRRSPAWEIDHQKLTQPISTAKFRQSVPAHTDAVNALVLADYNRSVVSAGDDGALMLWRPHGSHVDQVAPSLLGRHSDYCRTLAAARDVDWVVSGGFDQKIKLWDVGEGRNQPLHEFTNSPASIYALSTTATGSLIAAGSTESIIRVWDPRANRQVSKLSGHSDVVRSIKLSDDGKWLLSASSDSTVKIFSLVAQQILFTFSMHASSVWSLYSDHPTLSRFYSGDRDGLICKVDFEGDPAEGECVVLARDGPVDYNSSRTGREGITAIVAQDDAFVWSAGGDKGQIKRWKDGVTPRATRRGDSVENDAGTLGLISESPAEAQLNSVALPPVDAYERDRVQQLMVSFSTSPTSALPPNGLIASASIQRPSSLRASSIPHNRSTSNIDTTKLSPESATLNQIPYDSLVSLTSPEDAYFPPIAVIRSRDPETATIYSTTGSISRRPNSTHLSTVDTPPAVDPATEGTNIAEREYFERADALEATPFRTIPEEIIAGVPGGICRCEILNDRRHVLSIDTTSNIALWDIVQSECIGKFAPEEVFSGVLARRGSTISVDSEVEEMGHCPRSLLEYVKERIEGEGAISTWATITSKTGVVEVHLDEPQIFDAEVYADECHISTAIFHSDVRFNLGKWVLRSLFDEFITAELNAPPSTFTSIKKSVSTPISTTPTLRRSTDVPRFISLADLPTPIALEPPLRTPGNTLAQATPALSKALAPDLSEESGAKTPVPLSTSSTPRSRTNTFSGFTEVDAAKSSPRNLDDYFSLPPTTTPTVLVQTPKAEESTVSVVTDTTRPVTPSSTTPGGGLMGRLRFGKISKKVVEVKEEIVVPSETVEVPKSLEEQATLARAALLERPLAPWTEDAPALNIDLMTSITISEKTQNSVAFEVLYRGLVGSTGVDRFVLERELPIYALGFLLKGIGEIGNATKISFVLYPWRDVESAGLADLPNVNTRLTASRGLRVRKIHAYVADKLDLRALTRSRAASIVSVARPTINGGLTASTPLSTPITSTSSHSIASTSAIADLEEDFDTETAIEIICGEVVLPPHITLSTIRAFYWKSGGTDVVLHYRLRR